MALKINYHTVLGWLLPGMLLLAACNKNQPTDGLPILNLTLAENDAKPLGGKVFRTLAASAFEAETFKNNTRPFTDWYLENSKNSYFETGSVYMIVTPYLNIRDKEAEKMRDFVEEGHTLVVIADNWSTAFENTFRIGNDKVFAEFGKKTVGALRDTWKKAANNLGYRSDSFALYYPPFNRFLLADSTLENQQILSYNEAGKVDGLRWEVGDGWVILVTNAGLFTNYGLLTRSNAEYAMGILSYLEPYPDYLYWDDFFHRNTNRPPEDRSILDVLLSIPPLRWGFWLTLLLCGIWVLNNLVRRQRQISVIKAPKNTTVEFTQTIARLYFNKKDNQNIAGKMIQHFLEYMHSQHYLPRQKMDAGFAALLAQKTGQPLVDMQKLVARMADIQAGSTVRDEDLLLLHEQIVKVMRGKAKS